MSKEEKVATRIMSLRNLSKELWEQYGKIWDNKDKKKDYLHKILLEIKQEADKIEKDLK